MASTCTIVLMESFSRNWAALCGIGLSALYIYLQLLQWKRHGDDLMLTAGSIVVTVALWVVLLAGIRRKWKGGKASPISPVPQPPDLFKSPNFETVANHHFMSELVEIDGKRFVDCSFVNVTLKYSGKSPTEFLGNCSFTGQGMRLTTDNPAITTYARIQEVFCSIPNITVKKMMRDERGNELPNNYSIREVKKDQPSLRERVFSLAEELELFLKRHGTRPNPYTIPIKDKQEYTRIYNETVQVWDNKFQADFWKNYHEKIVNLRHELAIQSVTSAELDARLQEAQTASLADVTVGEIAKNLRVLAANL